MIKLLILLFTVASAKVLKLDDQTFDLVIKENEFVLVKFFAPWCGHCKKMAPEYEQVSIDAPDNVVIAEMDATENSEVPKRMKVQGYPTVKWFVKGEEQPYNGGRTHRTILRFIQKHSGDWIKQIATESDLQKLTSLELGNAMVLTNRENLTSLKNLSTTFPVLEFGQLVGDMKDLWPENSLRVYEHMDGELKQHEYSEGSELEFIQSHIVPKVVDMDSKHFATAFNLKKTHVIALFEEEDRLKITNLLLKLTEKNDQYLFVTTADPQNRITELFGSDKKPSIMILNVPEYKKYIVEGDLTEENIQKHLDLYKRKELKEHLKSQDVPEQEEGKPHVLVGSTFSEYIKNNDVFVKLYAPWCGHCKKLAPIWDELASKSPVKIAKYDVTANDHPDIKVEGFPTLRYYKNGKPIEYKGARTLDDLLSFVTSTSEEDRTDL